MLWQQMKSGRGIQRLFEVKQGFPGAVQVCGEVESEEKGLWDSAFYLGWCRLEGRRTSLSQWLAASVT